MRWATPKVTRELRSGATPALPFLRCTPKASTLRNRWTPRWIVGVMGREVLWMRWALPKVTRERRSGATPALPILWYTPKALAVIMEESNVEVEVVGVAQRAKERR